MKKRRESQEGGKEAEGGCGAQSAEPTGDPECGLYGRAAPILRQGGRHLSQPTNAPCQSATGYGLLWECTPSWGGDTRWSDGTSAGKGVSVSC